MNSHQRFFLALTLSLLLLGLAAHSAPAASLCACTNVPDSANGALELEACLVCQLQTGVQVSTVSPFHLDSKLPGANNFPSSLPLKHADKIIHPPILF